MKLSRRAFVAAGAATLVAGRARAAQPIKIGLHAGKPASRTRVQFVHGGLVPRPPLPGCVLPVVSGRIDNHAPAMHIAVLRPACRIRHRHSVW